MGKNKKKIHITYKGIGACQTVTGSSSIYTIKVDNKETKIMVDLGAYQDGTKSPKQLFDMNKLDFDLSDVDCILLTHAHLDHCMNLCQVPNLGFDGIIYSTALTQEIMEHITLDGIKIHAKTAEYLSKQSKGQVYPYMDMRSRENMLEMVRGYDYERWVEINEHIRFKFISNGHVSGSASIVIEVRDGYDRECIFISGDTSCGREMPFTKALDLADKKYSFTIMQLESTYADNYVPQKSIDEIIDELYNIVNSTCHLRKGVSLIPAFSFARSTNLFSYLKRMYEQHPELNAYRIYGISPLMYKCHKSIGQNAEFYDEKWINEMDLFDWKQITMITEYTDVVKIVESGEPCVIVSSSGMGVNGMNGFILPKIVSGRKNSVSFTGYLAPGTEGYKLINKQQKTISSYIDGKKYTAHVRAELKNISGLSSHASGQEIIDEILKTEKKKVRNIILVHGDEERCNAFKCMLENVYDRHVGIHVPRIGQSIKLT